MTHQPLSQLLISCPLFNCCSMSNISKLKANASNLQVQQITRRWRWDKLVIWGLGTASSWRTLWGKSSRPLTNHHVGTSNHRAASKCRTHTQRCSIATRCRALKRRWHSPGCRRSTTKTLRRWYADSSSIGLATISWISIRPQNHECMSITSCSRLTQGKVNDTRLWVLTRLVSTLLSTRMASSSHAWLGRWRLTSSGSILPAGSLWALWISAPVTTLATSSAFSFAFQQLQPRLSLLQW